MIGYWVTWCVRGGKGCWLIGPLRQPIEFACHSGQWRVQFLTTIKWLTIYGWQSRTLRYDTITCPRIGAPPRPFKHIIAKCSKIGFENICKSATTQSTKTNSQSRQSNVSDESCLRMFVCLFVCLFVCMCVYVCVCVCVCVRARAQGLYCKTDFITVYLCHVTLEVVHLRSRLISTSQRQRGIKFTSTKLTHAMLILI